MLEFFGDTHFPPLETTTTWTEGVLSSSIKAGELRRWIVDAVELSLDDDAQPINVVRCLLELFHGVKTGDTVAALLAEHETKTTAKL